MVYSQSKKAKQLLQSEIRNMSFECDKVNGINLSQGICDLPLEPILSKSVYEAMLEGHNHYTEYHGVDPLRSAIAEKASTFNLIECRADNITISSGATGALYSALYALLDPGDEVLLFEPYYGYHEYTLTSLDLVPVYSALSEPDWSIDFDNLSKKMTPQTKAIIICTPSNPCGKIFSKAELQQLGEFCVKSNLLVFTDEIYEYITYDNLKHISPASLDIFKNRTITISGYSKTFSTTGWRIGYTISNTEIANWIGNASDMLYVCAPAPLQYGLAEGIRKIPHVYYENLKNNFEIKRDLLCETLTKIGMAPHIPNGAYYVLADVSNVPGKTSKDKAMHILNKAGVGVVPGSSFFHDGRGDNLVRFCFAKESSVIKEACQRLEELQL